MLGVCVTIYSEMEIMCSICLLDFSKLLWLDSLVYKFANCCAIKFKFLLAFDIIMIIVLLQYEKSLSSREILGWDKD